MKKIFLLFALVIIALWWFGFANSNTPPVALSKRIFANSLRIRTLGKRFMLHRKGDRLLYATARKLIDHRLRAWKKNSLSSIPKTIHQIWPYDAPIPDHLALSTMMTKNNHTNFSYTLWTPQMYEEPLTCLLGEEWKTLPPQIIRDLAAATILWRYGGVVVDVETACVQTLSSVLSLGDCIIGFEPPLKNRSYQRRLVLSPSVIAAAPTHPLIQSWLTEMIGRIKGGTKQQKEKYPWICQDSLNFVATRPRQNLKNTLFVGPTYFCPVCPSHIHKFKQKLDGIRKFHHVRRILHALHIIDIPPFTQIARETLGVHMSGGRQARTSLLTLSEPKDGPSQEYGEANAQQKIALETGKERI